MASETVSLVFMLEEMQLRIVWLIITIKQLVIIHAYHLESSALCTCGDKHVQPEPKPV